MPSVNVYNIEGEKVREVELNADIFAVEVNPAVLHTVVRAQLANKRQGTKGTLTRTEVAGGGKKPFRQKGTGRSREGSTRSPQYYKGGVVFAPKSRDFSIAVPKKVKRLALKGALTDKVACESLIVVDALEIEAKTKAMVKVLANLKVEGKAYIVSDEISVNVARAAANLPGVKTGLVGTLNVVDLLNYDKLILTEAALKKLEEVYA